MEITNVNAATLLPYIASQLRDASYVAIDLEFTGIDRDGVEPDADTPAAVADSLMRKPAKLYPAKLETLKPYSIIQVGFSIFTMEAPLAPAAWSAKDSSTTAAAAATSGALKPTVAELAAHVKEFVDDSRQDTYYTHFLQRAVDAFAVDAEGGAASCGTSGWMAMMKLTATEAERVGTLMQGNGDESGAPYATDSTVELLHRYRFLEALLRSFGLRSREAEQMQRAASIAITPQPSGAASTPPAPTEPAQAPDSYRIQTFTAYMFPSPQDDAPNVSLNLDTAEFLVKNNIDLTRWVREGLRFKPLKCATAALAEDASRRVRSMAQLSQPHAALPHFTERFKKKLDDLLPFSPAELQFVKFILDLCEAPPSSAASHIVPYYIGAARPLLEFSRGQLHESKLPESIYVRDKIYRDEMHALSAIGITKINRRYARMSAMNGGGGSGSVSASASSDGTLNSSVATQGYGTALFEMLLYATEVLRKPLVFYNGYTDLMFLLLSLYGPDAMPAALDGFKALVHRHFPVLYDTRVLACAGPLQELGNFTGKLSNVVEEMSRVSSMSSQVLFHFDGLTIGGGDPSLTSAAHNAGFDAMLTGKLFAYAMRGIQRGGGDYGVYRNSLANYNTLLSINITEVDDGVLQEEPTPVYFLPEGLGLRVDSIREALARGGLTALVMFRGSGYTIQPVGKSCQATDYLQKAEAELTRQCRTPVTLTRINI